MKRYYYRLKRDLFRWAFETADVFGLWVEQVTGKKDVKQKFLEAREDSIGLHKLDRTLGTALNIKPAREK